MGAVSGRERDTAECLMHRGARFAATDRSHSLSAYTPATGNPGTPVGAVIGRERHTADCLTHRGAIRGQSPLPQTTADLQVGYGDVVRCW